MGSIEEENSVEDILNAIKLACDKLEQIGFHSLMLITSSDKHFEIGSTKGMQFNLDNFDYVINFMEYCQGTTPDPFENDAKLLDIPNTEKVVKTSKRGTNKKPKPSKRLKVEVAQEADSENDATFVKEEDQVDDEDDDDEKEEEEEDDDRSLSSNEPTVEMDEDDVDYVKAEGDSDLESDLDNDDEAWDQGDEDEEVPGSNVIVINANRKKGILATKPVRKMLTRKQSKTTKQDVTTKKAEKKKKASSPGVKKETVYHKCDQCDKRYLTRKDLVIHQRLHTGEAPFGCPFCEKHFRSRGLLRNHVQVHSTTQNYFCDICGMGFFRRNSIYRHKNKVHSEKERPTFQCDICGQTFGEKSILKMHKYRHEGYKPHQCMTCGKAFLERRGLVSHQLIHTGEKPYSCEKCGECFRMKKNLVTHQKNHHSSVGGNTMRLKVKVIKIESAEEEPQLELVAGKGSAEEEPQLLAAGKGSVE